MRPLERIAIVLVLIFSVLSLAAAILTGCIGIFVAFLSSDKECVFWGAGYVFGMAGVLALMALAFAFAASMMKKGLPNRWLFQLAPLGILCAGFFVNYHLFHKPYERCLQEIKMKAAVQSPPATKLPKAGTTKGPLFGGS